MGHVVLWPSHILIRHAGSSAVVPFETSWRALPKAPSRTRAEAASLAEQVAREASATPEKFAALAARYSEDVTSSSNGGAVGPITAWDLQPYPEVLDALAAMETGRVSTVIETVHGFHVFRRNPPPESHVVALRRMIVPYAFDENGVARARARAAAEEALYKARERSNVEGAGFGDDVGQWSTTEPTYLGRIVAAADHVPVGAYIGPVDTREGWQVVWRAPPRAVTRYAIERIQLSYEASASRDSAFSKESAFAKLKQIAAALRDDPSQFGRFQRLYCCREMTTVWTDGQQPPVLTELVSRLAVGETSTNPFDFEDALLLVKRIDPDTVLQEPTVFELPSPDSVDLAALARSYSGSAVQHLVREVRDAALHDLGITGPREHQFRQASQRMETLFGDSDLMPSERLAEYESITGQIRSLFGADGFATYTGVCTRVVTAFLMRPLGRRGAVAARR